jgi:glycosyltransferase involved in cell wall biosynthesis
MDVTVIIPAKNRLWSLPKAVESCRSREIAVQIIVVDDASDDGTAEWLDEQPDLFVVNGEGWGKPWGVNRAMSLATGEYVRYLDSDDWLNAGANEKQFSIGHREHADVVVGGCDTYKDDMLAESQPWIPTDDFVAQQLGETPGSHYSAFLFRREFIADIPHRTSFPASDFASRDDRCFILEVALRRPEISETIEPTLCHRHHQQARLQFQEGLRRDGTHVQELYIYKNILAVLAKRGELTERRKQAATKILWPLAHRLAYTYPADARDLVSWIFSLVPNFSPPESGMLGWLYKSLGFSTTERLLRVRRRILGLVSE